MCCSMVSTKLPACRSDSCVPYRALRVEVVDVGDFEFPRGEG